MKVFALAALIATTTAQSVGDDCFYDDSVCEPAGLICIEYYDGQWGDSKVCEDCSGDRRTFNDSYGDEVTFECPARPSSGGGGGGGSSSSAPEAEKATTLAMSAAALLAAVSFMN